MLRQGFILLLALIFIPSVSLAAAAETPDAWAEFHGQRFYLEIAADGPSRARGLMAREHLAVDRGMLFIFPDQRLRAFWMKHTLIPLDIIYLDRDYRVVDMALQAQPCKTLNCPTYPSRAPAQYVLEINAGLARRHGLKIGDVIEVFLP
jgi:uncharacterized membrane protein (UPF0127 family)